LAACPLGACLLLRKWENYEPGVRRAAVVVAAGSGRSQRTRDTSANVIEHDAETSTNFK